MGKKSAKHILCESTLSKITAGKVDREKGIIYDVRMAGLSSKNNREYTPEAYKNGASLYEGRPCNVNHVEEGKQVSAEDRFGVWHEVRWADKPEPGLVGNLHYIKSHPLAERVCEAAERKDLAGAFGMSHNAYAGDTRPGSNGKTIVESIAEVKSVDLVADPATVKGLFESVGDKPVKKTIKLILEEACSFPFQKKVLEAFCTDSDNAKRLAEEIDAPDAATPVEVANAAFDALAVAVVKDGSLAPKDKGAKVDAVATLQAKMLNGEEPAPKPEDETPQKKESVVGIKKANQLCESIKYTPSNKQLELLSESTEPVAKQLVEEFYRLSKTLPNKPPESAGHVPVQESDKSKPAASADELAKLIA